MKPADLTKETVTEFDSGSDNSDSESEDTKISDVKITKEFQENVIKYIKLDDAIKKKQEEIAELKKQRTPCEKEILKFLEDNDENVIDITDGKLRKNKSTTKQKLTEDIIKSAISQYEKDPSVVEEIIKAMDAKRPDVTHVNLKRTGKRVPKKKLKQKA
ncbi:hypothetical protein Indivirus_1_69 [Indivirus ILV1]|uniref:Uncharacterized protein n=1 Tax=Indivirus ILV1 TaxID=1977633 RepID=A0A1V0SCK7_9VIRU|nr:hypothetical protein Indivirus_1_69 [Indivirus ILV1]